MAYANPGPAADPDLVTPPKRSAGLTAGPGSSPRRVDLLAIAEGFAVTATAIPQLQAVTERTWVLLAVTDLFEAWAIAWPPGGSIDLHDHGDSHGAVVVAGGSLTETTVRRTSRGVTLIGTHHVRAGDHRRFGPRYVHDLHNDGHETAVSVHVYGPKLSVMHYYELDARGRLVVVGSETVPEVGPFDVTSPHDPS